MKIKKTIVNFLFADQIEVVGHNLLTKLYVQRPDQQVVQQVAAAQPIQYFQQQVQRPIRYVQQQNDQDWFNTFLTYYALSKNSDEEVAWEELHFLFF